MQGRRVIEHKSRALELYNNKRLHMSKSAEGGRSVFMAEQKLIENSGDLSQRVCMHMHWHMWECSLTHMTDILVSSVSMGHRG